MARWTEPRRLSSFLLHSTTTRTTLCVFTIFSSSSSHWNCIRLGTFFLSDYFWKAFQPARRDSPLWTISWQPAGEPGEWTRAGERTWPAWDNQSRRRHQHVSVGPSENERETGEIILSWEREDTRRGNGRSMSARKGRTDGERGNPEVSWSSIWFFFLIIIIHKMLRSRLPAGIGIGIGDRRVFVFATDIHDPVLLSVHFEVDFMKVWVVWDLAFGSSSRRGERVGR